MIEQIGFAAVRKDLENGNEFILLHEIRPFGNPQLINLLNRKYEEDQEQIADFPVIRIAQIAITEYIGQ